ncbi:tripartite tricarboxylate transporter substrate-binding protein [Salinicola sp. LHM]|uniref:Bug family tripartite tricarboxylate transporter substrate binding protein n=1 Tax=unclassified Salinicola TaxID=2634022 RepID=UPI0008DE1EBA|nr:MULTISPECIES: tripartite tricarboxylate transporter substrate-binding protein [unclassified Salinicola]OHZ04578.1 C4-dicarboxylate ABC transporter substrate-binding protein [Salinicola sp. MIT1003]WQH34879.1 tripartite tricarboxylate transporter substrate-binding protein [Salinicola sp. LHM]
MTPRSLKTLIAGGLLLSAASTSQAFEQSGKVDCIAPANPGGGWDFTCRSVGRVLGDLGLVDGNVQTTNMPGASGGVGFSHVVQKRAGQENLIVAASTVTTTGLARGQFPGMNAGMVNWIGTLGADYGVIAVAADSPYQSLNEVMAALKEDPRALTFTGGTASGGWDHLKLLMTANEAGVDDLARIAYLGYNGGGEAVTQTLGGHVDAFTGDISEVVSFIESGDLRPLAILSEERLPGKLHQWPTAREQGIDTIAPNWRGFYMPADVSEDAYEWWVDTVDTLYASDEWKGVMTQNGLMPFEMHGEAFTTFVNDQIAQIEDISRQIGLSQ